MIMKIFPNIFRYTRKPPEKLPGCAARIPMPRPELVCFSMLQTTYRAYTSTFDKKTWLG
jgi:hypothetical protein